MMVTKTKQRKKKASVKKVKALAPPPEQFENGVVKKQFTYHHETNTKTQTYRKSHIVDKWIESGAVGFQRGAINAIRECEFLWERMTCESLTASYEPRIGGGEGGMDRHEAIRRMARLQEGFDPVFWSVFENVVRHRNPAGKAASDLVGGSAKDTRQAMLIVGMVASTIAMRKGY